jgi:hypothetical protein
MKIDPNTFEPVEWDVIASLNAGHGVMWFALQSAIELARSGQGRVRLFADFVPELANLECGIDATARSQRFQGVEVLDHRLLASARPARNLLSVFDSVIPGAYAAAWQAKRDGRAFHLLPIGHGGPPSNETAYARLGINVMSMQQGAMTAGYGVIKPSSELRLSRKRLRHHPERASLWSFVKPPADWSVDHRIVLLAPGSRTDLSSWLEMLSRSEVPVWVFIARVDDPRNRARTEGSGLSAEVQHWSPRLSVTWLQQASWSLIDELLGMADLACTTQDDMALRALVSGCPVAHLAHNNAAERSLAVSRHMLSWWLAGSPPELRQAMNDLTLAWGYATRLSESWSQFAVHWDGILQAADEGARVYEARSSLVRRMMAFAIEPRPRDERFAGVKGVDLGAGHPTDFVATYPMLDQQLMPVGDSGRVMRLTA